MDLSDTLASEAFAQRARHPDCPGAFTRTRRLPLPALGALTMRIRVEDGRLMAQADGQSAFELKADSAGDLYPALGFPVLLTPQRPPAAAAASAASAASAAPGATASTAIERFLWRQGGGVTPARRLPAQP